MQIFKVLLKVSPLHNHFNNHFYLFLYDVKLSRCWLETLHSHTEIFCFLVVGHWHLKESDSSLGSADDEFRIPRRRKDNILSLRIYSSAVLLKLLSNLDTDWHQRERKFKIYNYVIVLTGLELVGPFSLGGTWILGGSWSRYFFPF